MVPNEDYFKKNLDFIDNFTIFALHWRNGRMAEWLGRGLQNLLQRFEPASDLI